MKKVTNPHDRYFKTAMADRRVAKEFFEHHLPEKILAAAELNSLRLENNSFVDEQLQASMADILYSVKLNHQPGYFYLLVEHQRKPDKLMPYRLLRYMLRIMDHHLKKKGHRSRLPVIVPLVFYNGEGRYPYSTDIFRLFGTEEPLARETFLKPFTLIDLTQIPDEEIKQLQWAGVMEFIQKHIVTRDFSKVIDELLPLLKVLEGHGAEDYLLATIHYFLQGNIDDSVKVATLLGERLSPRLGDEMMTLAERLDRAGFERGLAEGRSLAEKLDRAGFERGLAEGRSLAERLKRDGFEEGRSLAVKLAQEEFERGRAEAEVKTRRIACQLLEEGVDPVLVAKATGFSPKDIQELITASADN